MKIEKVSEKTFKINDSFYSLSNANDIDSLLCIFGLTDEYGYPNHKRYDELIEKLNNVSINESTNKKKICRHSEKHIEKKVQERTHQVLPTHKDILRNTTSKEYNFLANLISVSNFNDITERSSVDMEAFIYEKDLQEKLDQLKRQGVKVPSRNTIKKHMNTLSKIEIGNNGFKLINITNSPNGIVYHIAQSYEGKYFQSIPVEQFHELVLCTNNNVLKLYCIFKYTIENSKDEWVRIDRMYLCRHMGLTENEGSCNYLSIVIKALKKLGYLKVKQENIVELDEEGNKVPKTINYYRLTTYEEWYELTNKK